MTSECFTGGIRSKTNMLRGKVNSHVGGRKPFKTWKKTNSKVHSKFIIGVIHLVGVVKCLPSCIFSHRLRSFVARSVRKPQANTFPNKPLSGNKCTGADYMEKFSPGWNSSPFNQAEISAWPSDKILEKRSSQLHEESFSPVWFTQADNFSPVDGLKNPM